MIRRGLPPSYGEVYLYPTARFASIVRRGLPLSYGEVYLYRKGRFTSIVRRGLPLSYGKVYLYRDLDDIILFHEIIDCILSFKETGAVISIT